MSRISILDKRETDILSRGRSIRKIEKVVCKKVICIKVVLRDNLGRIKELPQFQE